jgi:LacI family transcriptional regulator
MAGITIKDIARESGYSTGTVSRVLNQTGPVSQTARDSILKVVRAHNFQLNSNAKFLKQRASTGVAVILKGTNNILFAGMMEHLQKRVEEKGYDFSVYYLQEEDNEVEQARLLQATRSPQGFLFLGSRRDNFRDDFASIDIPGVLVTNSAQGLPMEHLGSVSTDDAGAASHAIEYLISMGHEKIGVLGGKISLSRPAFVRYQGVIQAFERANLPFDADKQFVQSHFSVEDGYDAMNALLDRMPDVTGVFVMADIMAVGAVRAAADRNIRVPEDLSIVGFDGINLSQYLCPRLTTVRQDVELIAEKSADLLVDMIENGAAGRCEEIPHNLLEGESVAKLS